MMIFLLAIVVSKNFCMAQTSLVVAADGSGDYKTIQQAINSLPDSAKEQRIITIKKGTYNERIFIEKNLVTLKGEDQANTKIIFSQARDIFRCDNKDDWGVATLNLKGNDITLENLTVINNYGFEATGDVMVPCASDSSKTKVVKKTGHQMALRSFTTTRLIVKNCTFRALGGDTVSPWNKDNGMYYFLNCTLEGGVDFYCPRGWALAENCKFICHNMSAAIWHDGSANETSKTVLLNCLFTGDDDFKLGRYHRDAQFYLINCSFPNNMADADIYQSVANPPNILQWGKRVYYYDCHRTGGDYNWHKNNLPDSMSFNDINRAWVFDYKWDPSKGNSLRIDEAVIEPSQVKEASDAIADKMLLYQRKNGGWPKHFQAKKVNYSEELDADELKQLRKGYEEGIDATIDNEATTKEIKYLVKAYKKTANKKYLDAANNGIRYLLKAQYVNGGWPQFYPDLSGYRNEITYNDNAMINVLNIMQDIVEKQNDFDVIDPSLLDGATIAVERGISCILKTQQKKKKKLNAWCAQYDPNTLQPAKARKFELVSLSGAESVGIVRFLMRFNNPTPKMVKSIESAIDWLKKVQIKGYKYVDIIAPKETSGKDRVLVADSNSVLWARFYDMDTFQPFFSGRDGIKRYDVAEIENERRIGYAWYGTWAEKLITKEYDKWKTRITKQ